VKVIDITWYGIKHHNSLKRRKGGRQFRFVDMVGNLLY